MTDWRGPSFPALALLVCTAPALAAPQGVSVHGSWGTFRDEDRCYAIALADPSPYARERQPFASVSVLPAPPRFTMRLSRTLAPGAIVTLDVGSRRFRLGGAGDSAWGTDGINASANIVAAMRGSDTMTVGARDMQGRFFRDSYSLRGAPTAIDAAIVACR